MSARKRAFPGCLLLLCVTACRGASDGDAAADSRPDGAAASERVEATATEPDRAGAADRLLTGLPEACSLLSEAEASESLGGPVAATQREHSGKERTECRYTAPGGRQITLSAMFVLDDYYDPTTFRAFVEAMGMPVTGTADVPGGTQAYYGGEGETVAVVTATDIRGTALLSDRPVSHVIVGIGMTSPADPSERLDTVEAIAGTVVERLARQAGP